MHCHCQKYITEREIFRRTPQEIECQTGNYNYLIVWVNKQNIKNKERNDLFLDLFLSRSGSHSSIVGGGNAPYCWMPPTIKQEEEEDSLD